MIKSKKSQIQMGETIFVIVIVLFLIIFGFVFLFKAEEATIATQSDKFHELDSVALGQLVSNLPELVCSVSGVRENSCFDISKLSAFNMTRTNNRDIFMEYYFEKLGNVNITIEQIYPEKRVWAIYINDFQIEDAILGENIIQSQSMMKTPIVLKDSAKNKYGFGVLYVTKYRLK